MPLNDPVDSLVLAVVSDADADAVQTALVADEFRVTRINSSGGFHRRGNVTLLVGVVEREIGAVVSHVRENVAERAADDPSNALGSTMLVVLPVAKFSRV